MPDPRVAPFAWSPWAPSEAAWAPWSAYAPGRCGVDQVRQRSRTVGRVCQGDARCTEVEAVGACAGERNRAETQDEQRSAVDNCCAVAGGWSTWTLGQWAEWLEEPGASCEDVVVSEQPIGSLFSSP